MGGKLASTMGSVEVGGVEMLLASSQAQRSGERRKRVVILFIVFCLGFEGADGSGEGMRPSTYMRLGLAS